MATGDLVPNLFYILLLGLFVTAIHKVILTSLGSLDDDPLPDQQDAEEDRDGTRTISD